MNIVQKLAQEFEVKSIQIDALLKLLEEGCTVPFIARYRKEVTGGLTDTQLRDIVERLQYLTELEERRETILKSIEEQGKLTDELKKAIVESDNKTNLEDLYLPYKPKRRTKAQIAKEMGLEPLALSLLNDPTQSPEQEAEKFITTEITDSKSALEGARYILMELFAENATLMGNLRDYLWDHGVVFCKVINEKLEESSNFSDYFAYCEPIKKIPSHRALALYRGRKLDVLSITLGFEEPPLEQHCYDLIANTFNIKQQNRAADTWLWQVVEWSWKIKFHTKLELELLNTLRESADTEAINVFKDNLKNLLMTAPAGNKVVMGLDPGLRTGVKCVIIDGTGKVLSHTTIYPHAPRNLWDESIQGLALLCRQFKVELISIGNGTASRETDKLIGELMKKHSDLQLSKVVVSEAGASVYSASALAAKEFPDLDVSIRGAVSIARRLQDPLAELVKIDPKSIGVGQYQHDVNQVKLGKSLTAVLEDCVNAVGADVNTASVPLLTSIAGLNETIAKNIVEYREKNGRFKNRDSIKEVPRLGAKTFEQAIGFLRIPDGDNPLDASAVHPESYALVDRIIKKIQKPIKEIMGNIDVINRIIPTELADEQFGLPTVKDILNELKKPGRDPRPEFKVAQFQEGVEDIEHLKPDMMLEGVVTNVANFGAFVDIGVHQDGLVHISEVANQYVADIHQVLKVGQIVKVRVLEVDSVRKRISLSMKTQSTQNRDPKQPVKKPTSNKPNFVQKEAGLSLLGEKLRDAMKRG